MNESCHGWGWGGTARHKMEPFSCLLSSLFSSSSEDCDFPRRKANPKPLSPSNPSKSSVYTQQRWITMTTSKCQSRGSTVNPAPLPWAPWRKWCSSWICGKPTSEALCPRSTHPMIHQTLSHVVGEGGLAVDKPKIPSASLQQMLKAKVLSPAHGTAIRNEGPGRWMEIIRL